MRLVCRFIGASVLCVLAGSCAVQEPSPIPQEPAVIVPDFRTPPEEPQPREAFTVYFSSDSAELTPEARAIVAMAARSAAKGRKSIQVVGHTDSRGSVTYNRVLSARRADAVIRELGRHGIDSGIVIVLEDKGAPAIATPDGTDHPLNRRVEITVVR